MPHDITVGQLIHQLQTLDPGLPAYFAINPDWPYAHRIGQMVQITGPDGAVYIAENGQEGVPPPAVRNQLNWGKV
ncbi:hypothetical protein [Streptomyces sp. GS7]|uniref:hypothetical protein n=1 Tax=Streptomyces sp. GS7 TaxID=2692234 RepID=UPI0013199628|nr:hypothetical protein [Streptomyces sp. GS7]QHC23427.1 hypothetical protein GR130_20600 [Streptomyces sp. GS7]